HVSGRGADVEDLAGRRPGLVEEPLEEGHGRLCASPTATAISLICLGDPRRSSVPGPGDGLVACLEALEAELELVDDGRVGSEDGHYAGRDSQFADPAEGGEAGPGGHV